MGGRGWLSPKKHQGTSTKQEIHDTLKANGVKLVGNWSEHVNRRNLSLMAEIAETVLHLNKEFGKHIEHIVVEPNRKSLLATTALYEHTDSNGNKQMYRNVLIIPGRTLRANLKGVNKAIQTANKLGRVVPINMRQAVMHEFGHSIHRELKRQDRDLALDLEKRFQQMLKDPSGNRIFISNYAKTKAYGGKISSAEYVAESVVHILRGTSPLKGRDMVDLTFDYLSQVKGVDFNAYREKYPRVKAKKIKKKRGSAQLTTSTRGR